VSYAAQDATVRIGGATLLEEATLELHPGEVLAVVGPNGVGKSTLVRALAGDLRPAAGSVLLDGRSVASWSAGALAQRRSVMTTEATVAVAFTVDDVVLLGRMPHHGGTPENADRAICAALLEAVDCAHLAGRVFATLSSGERQRVSLARAIAQVVERAPAEGSHGGRFVLLDEPTSSLDPAHQHAAMRLLRDQARAGIGLLVVLHDLNLVAAYADRVALLDAGRIVEVGPPTTVLRPELLERVFDIPMLVLTHPTLAHPLIVSDPTRGRGSTEARLGRS
jgi:iron complex transport system ATP-binding protein